MWCICVYVCGAVFRNSPSSPAIAEEKAHFFKPVSPEHPGPASVSSADSHPSPTTAPSGSDKTPPRDPRNNTNLQAPPRMQQLSALLNYAATELTELRYILYLSFAMFILSSSR